MKRFVSACSLSRNLSTITTKRPSNSSKSNYSKNYTSTSKIVLSLCGVTIASSIILASQRRNLLNESKKRSHRIIILEDDDEEEEEEDDDEKRERLRKDAIANKPPITSIFSINDFETIAKAVLPFSYLGYYFTGSDDEISLRENHYAYGRIFFRPKCLVDVSQVSLSTEQFGIKFDAPFYISAFAGSHGGHPDAELNLIKAAGKERIPHMIPSMSSIPFETILDSTIDGQKTFFQIYIENKDQFDQFPEYLKNLEVEQKNKIKAVFITVDLPALGNREKDFKFKLILDPKAGDIIDGTFTGPDQPIISWDDVVRFKNSTNLPICVKGLQTKEDVLKAIESGLAGCVISNHGGRQLDFAMPTIEILAETQKYLKEKKVDASNFEIFVDGGVRRGSDIIKALCLGATGVGLGRPFLYAMSSYGQPGVERAIQILKTEMVRDMKLLGVSSIEELNRDLIDIESLKYKGFQSTDNLYNSNYIPIPAPSFKK